MLKHNDNTFVLIDTLWDALKTIYYSWTQYLGSLPVSVGDYESTSIRIYQMRAVLQNSQIYLNQWGKHVFVVYRIKMTLNFIQKNTSFFIMKLEVLTRWTLSSFSFILQNVHILCSNGSFGLWWRPTSILNLWELTRNLVRQILYLLFLPAIDKIPCNGYS